MRAFETPLLVVRGFLLSLAGVLILPVWSAHPRLWLTVFLTLAGAIVVMGFSPRSALISLPAAAFCLAIGLWTGRALLSMGLGVGLGGGLRLALFFYRESRRGVPFHVAARTLWARSSAA